MKAGELRKVTKDFSPLFSPSWKQVGNSFMRRCDSWLQIVSFNASRWADNYNPVNTFDFLKMPGVITGGSLVQLLVTERHQVQRWVTIREHQRSPEAIFEAMASQFKPSLQEPLNLEAIKVLLHQEPNVWPHSYALCVMALEEGNMEGARRYYEQYLSVTSEIYDNPYISQHREELLRYIALAANRPEELAPYLSSFRRL